MTQTGYVQEPVAIIGMACRLPGGSDSPQKLWEMLERGGIADVSVPESRFNIKGHYDGSKKPGTMRPPGGYFLKDNDLAEFDASFFEISRAEAISTDPNQRQLLEVVYECLENAGIPLEQIDGAPVGCFIGSYAVDYHDIQSRDPEDRPPSIEVGIGRAILSNRISHFLNIKGPSITLDTACSGSLVGVDIACRYLGSREIDCAIVAASNLYLSPEHVQDTGPIRMAHSPSGRCHTFDAKADGYIKAEAVNAVILKRLKDAIKDGDPIHAVIRGSSTNSDGRTPGISSPSPTAQAAAVRAAYANAGLSDLSQTGYLECHGTGTQAGDPLEVNGVSSVFADFRTRENPLTIGSVKSNLGHSEAAAGLTGLFKAVLAIEHGLIPGNPTFETPNPKIDFEGLKVRATQNAIPWPEEMTFRRASINSFGYGGTNSHVIIDEPKCVDTDQKRHTSSYVSPEEEFELNHEESGRPYVIVLSANDEQSLKRSCENLDRHLSKLDVQVRLQDLAYTLSERRSRHFHRGYVIARSTEVQSDAFTFGKKSTEPTRLGFVFTGQGAQWPQMGKELIELFPYARTIISELDVALQSLGAHAPAWSLLDELSEPRSADHLRQPEFSQPLVTALQIAIFHIYKRWGVHAQAVLGHSSGEIAAAYAAGYLSKEDAIKVAYYRGWSAKNYARDGSIAVGMMAAGLGGDSILPYLDGMEESVQIACFNSPKSVTLSGTVPALETVRERLTKDGHFARQLQVDLAYHSRFMSEIGQLYEQQLIEKISSRDNDGSSVTMFSSVSGQVMAGVADAAYWKENMVSPVRFGDALNLMLSGSNAPNFLIEIGPAGALAGPISQIKAALGGQAEKVQYTKSLNRVTNAITPMFDNAGKLFLAGANIDFSQVNYNDDDPETLLITDLPNYSWNHSVRYWHESDASKDWRFRPFPQHDLLGTKVLGSPWHTPTFKKILHLEQLPWLRDHKMGSDCLMPASGFIAMAIEALYQTTTVKTDGEVEKSVSDMNYRFRNVKFEKALVLEDGVDAKVILTLTPSPGTNNPWYDFNVSSVRDATSTAHCGGLIRTTDQSIEYADEADVAPLKYPTPGHMWYKAQNDVGYGFGPEFQRQVEVESLIGQFRSRSTVNLKEPKAAHRPQSQYAMHPASLDGCFQTTQPSLWRGNRSIVDSVVVPASIDELIVNGTSFLLETGISVAHSEYTGRGRKEQAKNYWSSCSVFDPSSRALLLKLSGLRYHQLDIGVEPHAAHTLGRTVWKPDISLMPQEQVFSMLRGDLSGIQDLVDLVAHKRPNLKVFDYHPTGSDFVSLWFDQGNPTLRSAYTACVFGASDAKALVELQTLYDSRRRTTFNFGDITSESYSSLDSDFDLAIIQLQSFENSFDQVARNLQSILAPGATAIFLELEQGATPWSDSGSISSDSDLVHVSGAVTPIEADPVTTSFGFAQLTDLSGELGRRAYFAVVDTSTSLPSSKKTVAVVSLRSQSFPRLNLASNLQQKGWDVQQCSIRSKELENHNTVVIVDELHSPLLANVSERQWQSLKELLTSGRKVLWVTEGSQMTVRHPDNALVHGFFRTIRAEDRGAKLATLDVEYSGSPSANTAIERVLLSLVQQNSKTSIESEFVERGGVICVNRMLPDELITEVHKSDTLGGSPKLRFLDDVKGVTMLRAERQGTLDALNYSEMSTKEVPVEYGMIEVDIRAAGLNFKDVAVTMGIVHENEHLLGLEGSGVVRRIGEGVGDKFKVGDRVVILRNGTFANRIQCPIERAHLIPDSLSFEDASTMPLVYLTSFYSLFDIGGLSKGKSVLIHSAAGGVGLSCIQLAKWIGADIFVTVGSEEKRKYLHDTYGIPFERMFSSRDTMFASEIMKATSGRGIDVIINSLVGELLDESWRICADGGSMVEIGKKDILDRNYLSMEPFDRNCSFKAVDFSYTKDIKDDLIQRLLVHIFDLYNKGCIGPIHPITTYPFAEIPAAFAYMRGGKHLGKIIITDGGNPVKVPVRPAARDLKLRPDRSYLIVGGLRGLCGSLATYMAWKGAKNIIAFSRSGASDERSQKIVANCNAMGCNVQEARGDVSKLADVLRAFEQADAPVAGIIQGAMVLRDRPYETMTVEDFHTTLSNKVAGTWNLHNACLQQKHTVDFFSLLSSVSGVVGQKGQANYSAANVFLDAFAVYRRSLGLAAHSVNLGVIEDVGYVADQGGMKSHFDDKQWNGINESMLHKILSFSIFQQSDDPINGDSLAQMITGIPYPQPESSELSRDARFSHLFVPDGGVNGNGGRAGGTETEKAIQALFLLHGSGADSSALLTAAVDLVGMQFTKTLRLSDPIEPGKSLSTYGLDSLSAVEFRNWIRTELGADVTVLEITSATSLFALCEKIIVKLPKSAAAST